VGLTVDSLQLTFLPSSKSRNTDSFWKRPGFQLWRAHDFDLRSGRTAYRRASLIDLYLHCKFHWNWKKFL